MCMQIGGISVIGQTHAKKNVPLQDSVSKLQSGGLVVIAVADGHGSEVHFRSGTGAQIATQNICGLLKECYEYSRALNKLTPDVVAKLKQSIVYEWRKQVSEHIESNPFEQDEAYKMLSAQSRARLQDNPVSAYGTTLLAAAVDNEACLFLQIGDGNILLKSGETVVDKTAINDKNFINETMSLCSDGALSNISIAIEPKPQELSLIMLATDGVINSFPDESDFLQIPNMLLHEAEESNGDDFADFDTALEGFLKQLAAKGSGDDCTIAYMLNINKKTFKEKKDGI